MENKLSKKLIQITDILETKLRKEKEIEYYEEQIVKIRQKMMFLQKDLDLTKLIISIIEKEKVYDIKQEMETRMIEGDDDEI
jgi:hypothetical protein